MKPTLHNKNEKFLISCLKKMFSIVGGKYSPNFTKQKNWYLKRSWSEEQELEFKQFFIKEAEKQLRLPKRRAKWEFEWFNLSYGWKREPETITSWDRMYRC